ncbi:hypothetical protein [Blastopirellula marina]|uniref:hypothetical protein n=1 Tax=Blastopirellula marina TaxID=124 RepID=UPI0011AFE760|nr:hypothetical protein [Blastopirellula marina]
MASCDSISKRIQTRRKDVDGVLVDVACSEIAQHGIDGISRNVKSQLSTHLQNGMGKSISLMQGVGIGDADQR